MHHIIYMSRPIAAMPDAELQELLTRARLANLALGVTGILFYNPTSFAQMLEGEQSVVEKLYQKIATDPRHTSILKLADKPIAARSFAAWAMSYQPMSAAASGAIAGYLNLAHVPTPTDALSAADALLYTMIRATVLPPVA